MQDSRIYKLFKQYNLKHGALFLICPLCNKPFCNEFGGRMQKCSACRDKQRADLGGLFCGYPSGKTKIVGCECGQDTSMKKSILILYLMILLDYIDNLEYQLAVIKERYYENTR